MYQKYAFFTMQEIRDCMLDLKSLPEGQKQEVAVKTDNCAELDIDDILHMHSDLEESDL